MADDAQAGKADDQGQSILVRLGRYCRECLYVAAAVAGVVAVVIWQLEAQERKEERIARRLTTLAQAFQILETSRAENASSPSQFSNSAAVDLAIDAILSLGHRVVLNAGSDGTPNWLFAPCGSNGFQGELWLNGDTEIYFGDCEFISSDISAITDYTKVGSDPVEAYSSLVQLDGGSIKRSFLTTVGNDTFVRIQRYAISETIITASSLTPFRLSDYASLEDVWFDSGGAMLPSGGGPVMHGTLVRVESLTAPIDYGNDEQPKLFYQFTFEDLLRVCGPTRNVSAEAKAVIRTVESALPNRDMVPRNFQRECTVDASKLVLFQDPEAELNAEAN